MFTSGVADSRGYIGGGGGGVVPSVGWDPSSDCLHHTRPQSLSVKQTATAVVFVTQTLLSNPDVLLRGSKSHPSGFQIVL